MMFNVCSKCGAYQADKVVDKTGPYAICGHCGYKHKFVQLPLFILTGASGTGKSTIGSLLASKIQEVVVMESDILWREEFNTPETDYREFRELWLQVCKNISQNGKSVVLCGCVLPSQYENCVEQRYFSNIHYMALTCHEKLLIQRLRERPKWRDSGEDDNIQNQIRFNNWFIENSQTDKPAIKKLDTSLITVVDAVEKVVDWVSCRLNKE